MAGDVSHPTRLLPPAPMTPRSSSQFWGQLQLVGGPVRHEKPGPVALDRPFLTLARH